MNVEIGDVNQGGGLEGIAALEDRSVDLVFADPPVNIGYDHDT